MTFEFNQQLSPLNEIEIDEIGDFAIEASDTEGRFYYMIVKTQLGVSCIATCGPIVPDVNILPSGYSQTFVKMPYKENKLAGQINFFLNRKKTVIDSAKIIPFSDAVTQFRDLGKYLIENEGNY